MMLIALHGWPNMIAKWSNFMGVAVRQQTPRFGTALGGAFCRGPEYMPEAARIRIGLGCLIALVFWTAEPANCQDQLSRIEDNTFISPANPKIRVKVDRNFEYVGSVPFTIDDQAGGNRYVFVHATRDKHIQRMFIIQLEGLFVSTDEIYRYKITTAAKLGDFDYRHSVIVYDNDASIREEPGKEADLTQRFLAGHGYTSEPELVMSRFARPVDSERKHEIIFFCFENLSSYKHKLQDFPEGLDSPEKQAITRRVNENCRSTFRVNH
jgi:hypothetical protein